MFDSYSMKPQTQEVTTGFDIPKDNDRERPPKDKRGAGRGGGRGGKKYNKGFH